MCRPHTRFVRLGQQPQLGVGQERDQESEEGELSQTLQGGLLQTLEDRAQGGRGLWKWGPRPSCSLSSWDFPGGDLPRQV